MPVRLCGGPAVTGNFAVAPEILSGFTPCIIARAERDGTRAETRFRLSQKRTSPFKSVGASVQSTAGSRGVRISFSNAGYTTFGGGVRVLATHLIRQFPLRFPSRASPCATRFRTSSTKDAEESTACIVETEIEEQLSRAPGPEGYSGSNFVHPRELPIPSHPVLLSGHFSFGNHHDVTTDSSPLPAHNDRPTAGFIP